MFSSSLSKSNDSPSDASSRNPTHFAIRSEGLWGIKRKTMAIRSRQIHVILSVFTCMMLAAFVLPTLAQQRTDDSNVAPFIDAPGMIELNFPENAPLQALLDYVGKRKGVSFLYDAQVMGKKITLDMNGPIPADSLMSLLADVLKMNNLTITTTDVDGLLRIESATTARLTQRSRGPGETPAEADLDSPTTAVTRLISLEHTTPDAVKAILDPFLSSTQASLTPLPNHNLIMVTDYARNMRRIESILAMVDRPGREVVTRFIPLRHVKATDAANQAKSLLGAGASSGGKANEDVEVTITAIDRLNQIAIVGRPEAVERVTTLIASIDAPLGLDTRIYQLTVASPKRVDELVRSLISEIDEERFYKSATDQDGSLLIVTTTPTIHEQIEQLRSQIDQPIAESRSPVRFYKLENAKAIEVLETLRSIEGDRGLDGVSVNGIASQSDGLPQYPRGPTEAELNRTGLRDQSGEMRMAPAQAVTLSDARVMADEPTNTIIVVARPSMHAVYEELIKRLDVRRPQVLIEATIVLVDTTNDFRLGVEIRSQESADGGTLLNFTQFGLSTTDAETGALALSPGTGFNGALLNADTAQFVIRALESDSKARIVSRPTVLIDDNERGQLSSLNREPYESVNASNTVATTTLGGFVEAGTVIEVIPQISEGDHVKLAYSIELSSFDPEGGGGTLPPAEETNELHSFATIPDGHTIVIGGLTRETMNEDIDRVPILGRIPILEYLLSSRSTNRSQSTLFLFLRAVILRDDQFKDLKVISRERVIEAELDEGMPASEPVEIR